MQLQNASFTSSRSTASCSNTTTSAPAPSSRCASFPKTRSLCSDWSAASVLSWNRRTTCSERIDQAAKFLPLEQLAVSPQCGFASTMEGNLLTEDDQWAKLQLVVDTARDVWG